MARTPMSNVPFITFHVVIAAPVAPLLVPKDRQTRITLARATHRQLHQAFGEGRQGDVVGKDGLSTLGSDTTISARSRCVSGGRIELGEQEAGLGAAVIADNKTRQRETVSNKILRTKTVSKNTVD